MSATYKLIRQAMLDGKSLSLVYHGHRRSVCAHVIGKKNGRPQVLTYQYAGTSSSGLPTGGQWRCMIVDQIQRVEVIDGQWKTDHNHNQAQTCVDQIDVELWVGADGKPYVKRA